MNTTLYLNNEYPLYRKVTKIYKDIIKTLQDSGYHTRYIVEMELKNFNGVEVFTGAKAFNRNRFKELITVDTSKIELTVNDYGYITLITYTSYDETDYIENYVSLWSVQPIEQKKV